MLEAVIFQNRIGIRPERYLKEMLYFYGGGKAVLRQHQNIVRIIKIISENMSVAGNQLFGEINSFHDSHGQGALSRLIDIKEHIAGL